MGLDRLWGRPGRVSTARRILARIGSRGLLDMLLAKKRAADRREWLETKGNLATVE